MGIALGIIGIIEIMLWCSIYNVPKSEYEQRLEDEEQIEYLRKYQIEHERLSRKAFQNI